MIFRIRGYVVDIKNGSGVPGLMIKVNDQGQLYDSLLGQVRTDENGFFVIDYEGESFQELF